MRTYPSKPVCHEKNKKNAGFRRASRRAGMGKRRAANKSLRYKQSRALQHGRGAVAAAMANVCAACMASSGASDRNRTCI